MYYIASSNTNLSASPTTFLSQHAIERDDGCYSLGRFKSQPLEYSGRTTSAFSLGQLSVWTTGVARLQVEESRRESVFNVFLSCYGFISAAKHQH
jgi:hypothetical protein